MRKNEYIYGRAEVYNFQNLSPVHKGAVKGSRNTWIHCDICQFFSAKLALPGRGSEEGTSPSPRLEQVSNFLVWENQMLAECFNVISIATNHQYE